MNSQHLLPAAAALLLLAAAPGHAGQHQPGSPFVGQPNSHDLIYPGRVLVTFPSEVELLQGLDELSQAPGATTGAGGGSVGALGSAGRPSSRRIGQRSVLIPLSEPFSVTGQAESPRDLVAATWQTVRDLSATGRFASVEPVYIAYPSLVPNDSDFPLMWHYHSRDKAPGGANFTGAWEYSTGKGDIRVAVIDTGILPGEPEFNGSPNLLYLDGADLVSDPWMANDGQGGIPGDGVDYDTDPRDSGDGVAALECGLWQTQPIPDSWHGSHVSGTIGAGRSNDNSGIAGAAWHVSVIPIRVLGRCGGTTVDIAEAIRWAAGMRVEGIGRVLDPPADIINLSLGGAQPCSSVAGTIQAAINDAVARGALVVAAAGNNGVDASNFFPASCDNVITVAASGGDGRLVERYSNYGAAIDIMAPGGDIEADRNRDGYSDGVLSVVKGGYRFYNGTSMAAPHVSAALALLLSVNPDIRSMSGAAKYHTIRGRLSSSAVEGSADHCSFRYCGDGLLDVEALLRQ